MIAIVDYGLGNIQAFANAFKKLNIPYCLASKPLELEQAQKIILPGVGAFDYAMSLLNASGLRESLDILVLEKMIPLLGVCVGMQILGETSEEGVEKGLGWIAGRVKKIPVAGRSGLSSFPLPHMGWNNLLIERSDPLLTGLSSHSRFYFLHSYYFTCQHESTSLASAEYGMKFSCIIRHKNIYGIQCHPEKSHEDGLTLLKNFALV